MLSTALLVVRLAQIPAYALLGYKLYSTGLASVYRYLTAFAVFEALRVLAAVLLPKGTDLYASFYVVTQPIVWLFYALITLEVYQTVFRAHRGIAAFSRHVIWIAVVLSSLLACATLLIAPHPDSPYLRLEYYFGIERAINFSLLCFVLVLIAFLTWFPVPLARNALVHSGVFSLYFGARGLAFLARTIVGPDVTETVSVVVMLCSVISITLWISLLSRSGEEITVRSGYRRDAVDEERLLEQLESINRTLLRSAKD